MAPEVAELVVELNASKEYEAKMLNAPYHQSLQPTCRKLRKWRSLPEL